MPRAVKGERLARLIGETVATNFFHEFEDPARRGSKFVWPDSLHRLVQGQVATQLFLYNVSKKHEEAAQKAASCKLDELLAVPEQK